MNHSTSIKTLQWVSSLYFFQSIPFVVVSLISTIIYQQYNLGNVSIAFFTSLLMIPWAIKPLFAPFLERFASKKNVTIFAQFILSILFLALAISVTSPHFLIVSSCCFILLAFISSTHDIASDGVYLLNLDEEKQKRYVAARSFFYQMGRLFIKGVLLVVIGQVAFHFRINVWQLFFLSLFIIGVLLTFYHSLKLPEKEQAQATSAHYGAIFKEIGSHEELYVPLLYIFLYNFMDGQLQKIIPLFLLDKTGLGLNLSQVGEIYGIYGSAALISGVFISGFLLTRFSLAQCLRCLTPLLFLSPLLFLLLAWGRTNELLLYTVLMGYQFILGITNGAYMGYLLRLANKSMYPMSMYTVCTSIMALSYVFWGAISGMLEQYLGYSTFFTYVLAINCLLIIMTYRIVTKDV
ncbi:MFS transporter [Legionella hackeliae]|uniref:Beta lactamase induction signal transducer AmpG n=1 Tax=Legionella hackeliae TaxID=449 RepID=A0A0A8USL9_LEGHA|nr:MFS transporter [Legionella hackeliae]KTD09975.1 beta lactamase induction signal transducer AmpG [Legionella hackeliae]CEK11723.1 membrane protein of unknown function [Legionella hackeliae]STX48493.1 beta lactamase induction signal transducer AmpG [Legionella hackeliae]